MVPILVMFTTYVLLLCIYSAESSNVKQNVTGVNQSNLHRQFDNKMIKANLDNFTMKRRKTYTITPEFNHNVQNVKYDERVIDTEVEVDKIMINEQNFHGQNTVNVQKLAKLAHTVNRITTRKAKSTTKTEDYLNKMYFNKMNELIDKQEELVQSLGNIVRKRAAPDDFSAIVASAERKRNGHARLKASTAVRTALLQEVDLRKALVNDPFVKRILKLAKRKNKIDAD